MRATSARSRARWSPRRSRTYQPPIRLVMKRAVKRTWKRLLDERIGGDRRTITLGSGSGRSSDDERRRCASLVEHEPIRKLDHAARGSRCRVAGDARRCRVLGQGLQLARPVARPALVEFPTRRKKGIAPVARAARHQAGVEAERAVGARRRPRLSPGVRVVRARATSHRRSAARMLAASLLEPLGVHSRAVSAGSQGRARSHRRRRRPRGRYYLGKVVGRAHRRQLRRRRDPRLWLAELTKHRTKNLDAPSWLWRALVQLVGLHEHAYLEHCRRYALAAGSAATAHGLGLRPAARARARAHDLS